MNINAVDKMKTIIFHNNLCIAFIVTSVIGQACLSLLKFKKKSDNLETSSIYVIENSQYRLLNNTFLLGRDIAYWYVTSKKSEQIFVFNLIPIAIAFKNVTIKMLNAF